MPEPIRRIGLLTGGGDCPGLNAVIRAVVKTAIYRHGIRVYGIEDGFQGLIEDRISELTSMHVTGILTRGGTILGTNNRCNPTRHFVGDDDDGTPRFENKIETCLENIRRHQLDAIIVVGGDGTMTCAAPFVEAGVNCIGVPKTIDNDLVGTDLTFGFLSAVSTATEALDRLHSTAASHHRVMVCEVMGRHAGWIALYAGVASGSDVILIPEIPFDLSTICRFVQERRLRGRGFSIICCAEGARPAGGEVVVARRVERSPDPIRLGGVGKVVADTIAEQLGLETRTTVLGHVQRGGSPVPADRILATQFGHHAMEVLAGGGFGRMIVMHGYDLADMPILEVVDQQRTVPLDHALIRAARSIKTCFGDEGGEGTGALRH